MIIFLFPNESLAKGFHLINQWGLANQKFFVLWRRKIFRKKSQNHFGGISGIYFQNFSNFIINNSNISFFSRISFD